MILNETKIKTPVIKAIEKSFANRIYSKKFDYDVNKKDLYLLFEIFNEYIFNSKLDKDALVINIITTPFSKEKGNFYIGKQDGKNVMLFQL